MQAFRRLPDPVAVRLALFYTAYFAVAGIMLPYWPAWLESRGLDPVTIGAVLAVGFWIKLAAHPAMAAIADASGALRGLTVLLSGGALVVYAAFWMADEVWHYLVLAGLAGITFQSIMPLGEALALAEVKARRLDYGRIRIAGSLSFMAAAALCGWAVDHYRAGVVPAAGAGGAGRPGDGHHGAAAAPGRGAAVRGRGRPPAGSPSTAGSSPSSPPPAPPRQATACSTGSAPSPGAASASTTP